MTAAAAEAKAARRFRCMAVDVTVELIKPVGHAESLADRVEAIFRQVESSCTRFDPTSALMLANAAGQEWHEVPPTCFDALTEAALAHRMTRGRFDPRILRDLHALGYDRSLPFGRGPVDVPSAEWHSKPTTLRFRSPWNPGFDPTRGAVRIGPFPVDLGGIGKGLAVRWAAEALRGRAAGFLVEAGGDLITAGAGPSGDGWRAAVEDPRGGEDPVAVLDVTDVACATSSIRLRSWHLNGRTGRKVHHIIDPLTGEPGGAGLLSVTVIGPDPAAAEVWSKTLFLAGAGGIARAATTRGLRALWIDGDGRQAASPAMVPHVLWQAPDVG